MHYEHLDDPVWVASFDLAWCYGDRAWYSLIMKSWGLRVVVVVPQRCKNSNEVTTYLYLLPYFLICASEVAPFIMIDTQKLHSSLLNQILPSCCALPKMK